ncbi:MAG TPA: hypothetical protein VFJ43_12635, partial [Bacteroidia bacterium]|nr:hypothetical protein [Bacteroidia bacterium]
MFSRISLFILLTIGSFLSFFSFVNPHLPVHFSDRGKYTLDFFRYDDGDSRRIVVNHEYSMDIPNSLVEDKTLNAEASLQYADVN